MMQFEVCYSKFDDRCQRLPSNFKFQTSNYIFWILCISVLKKLINHRRRLKAFAAADGGDPQVERGMLWVGAFIDDVFVRLVLGADLDELGGIQMVLAKMKAQSALAIVNLHHGFFSLTRTKNRLQTRGQLTLKSPSEAVLLPAAT
jgi:hypothetical protein